MEVQATTKYVRIAPRKVRLLANEIKKMSVKTAVEALKNLPKSAVDPLLKTILSAIANAKQKEIKTDNLKFKLLEVNGGPSLKRWRAVSRGRAHGYKKRMTHIKVILTD